ncbi:DNA repair protein RecN [Caenispirillum salinarum]|uniref:DNA repair protein RecN n=1 Tax=Caenispirillum salinarum TaxID=859058 RepID=UPI00384F125C
MLVSLSIRDVVLIDRLDLHFEGGLSVLTGETGAGKSILLDSLGLALGDRADSGLVRHGCDQAVVTAVFDLPSGHPARDILGEQGLDAGEDVLTVRRVVTRDGRSRAFADDQPVSVGLLRKLGDTLVEIHGQFDTHGLLNPATHLGILDAYGGLEKQARAVKRAWTDWRAKAAERAQAEADLAKDREEEAALRHSVEELRALNPKPGEEAELAERRGQLMHGEQIAESLNGALNAVSQECDVEAAFRHAQRALQRVLDKAEGTVQPILDALDRAAIEASEALNQLERAVGEIDLDPRHLEQVEERLFDMRALARKHSCEPDDLPAVAERFEKRLAALEGGGSDITRLLREEQAARQAYVEAARALSKGRAAAAGTLDRKVKAELAPLKLDKATFVTRVEERPEEDWSSDGLDRVAFLVATNPGAPPGPLSKIASGGELSRFTLALKVILAAIGPVPTLIFDEVDAGIGGATAAAVGERLERLAAELQVLVVTHSPQVAARGQHHFRVAKFETKGRVSTTVTRLDPPERREEVARMLAGERVTEEARAAADSLLTATTTA